MKTSYPFLKKKEMKRERKKKAFCAEGTKIQ
jgi:hypothetical protein